MECKKNLHRAPKIWIDFLELWRIIIILKNSGIGMIKTLDIWKNTFLKHMVLFDDKVICECWLRLTIAIYSAIWFPTETNEHLFTNILLNFDRPELLYSHCNLAMMVFSRTETQY